VKKTFATGVIALIFLIISTMPVLAAGAIEQISLGSGQSRTLNIDGLQRAAIADPEVADVVVASSSELVLVGKQTGSTTLIVWSGEGRQNYQV